MTSLVLQVSMGGGDRLPSGDPSARLPSYFIKKKNIAVISYKGNKNLLYDQRCIRKYAESHKIYYSKLAFVGY